MSISLFDALSWLYPWLLLLLPLPWLCWRFLAPVQQAQAVAHIPFASDWGDANANATPTGMHSLRLLLLSLIWLAVLLAAARPEWHGDAVELPVSGRDLVLAVDISGSMRTRDFNLNGQQVDRLTATKAVADAFIQRRTGDRVGLILFGTHAYVQTPLTFDRQTVRILLNESAIGLAGKATAIGDTIALAVKRMQQSASPYKGDDQKPSSSADSKLKGKAKPNPKANNAKLERVLILLTDGVNTAGELTPRQATNLAVEAGLKIYTIGIGADSMTVDGFFGSQQINPSAELDEKGLTAIAERTGGRYFRARDTAALNGIYHIIDRLEPVVRERDMFRPLHALFIWPLGFALLLSTLLFSTLPLSTLLLSTSPMPAWRHLWKS